MKDPKDMTDEEMKQAMDNAKLKTHEAKAVMYHCVESFGDELARREGYRRHKGKAALQFYLVQKYHWLPRDVYALSWDELNFLFEEEIAAYSLLRGQQSLRRG